MLEEIIPIVLEVLIEHRSSLKIEDIIEYSCCEKQEVSRSLEILYNLNLVKKNKDEGSNIIMFSVISELKGIHLAKAAQLGLDLSVFDKFFKIDDKEKKLALELATQVEKIKNLDLNKRKPLLQKRTYLNSSKSDGIYENLLLLLEATNVTLYEHIDYLAEKDAYLKLLIEMHQQAENSLRDYHSILK